MADTKKPAAAVKQGPKPAPKKIPAKPRRRQASRKVKAIRVTARHEGFRRGGRAWSGTTTVPVADFSKQQLAQIRAESLLNVEDVTIDG